MTSGPLRSEPDPITGVSIPLNPDGSTDWPTFAGELRSGLDEVAKPKMAKPRGSKPKSRLCPEDDGDTGLHCQLREGHDPPHVAVVEWTDEADQVEYLIGEVDDLADELAATVPDGIPPQGMVGI